MKRVLTICAICSALSFGSFGLLILQDRRLGVPLPYSFSLACLAMTVLAPALLSLFEALRRRRPIVVQRVDRPASVVDVPAAFSRRRTEGVVLLDFSSVSACGEHAA